MYQPNGRILYWTILILLAFIYLLACKTDERLPSRDADPKPTRGLTLVAPPNPFPKDPMPEVSALGSNWIAVVPYAFTPPGAPQVRFGSKRQWWGERPEGIWTTIVLAQKQGLKVLLKPQVWSPGWWTGDYDFDIEDDWKNWESDYLDYILHFARLADSMHVDAFCIGTEFKTSVAKRPEFWEVVISEIRNIYDGQLTYAANWDNYERIPFWSKLDFIGINAYFPLSSDKNPTLKTLIEAWGPIRQEIRGLAQITGKPVAFTEYGYLSVDGCAGETWKLEERIKELKINEQAQAVALDALHLAFCQEPYWLGGFLWKWFPNMQGHEGYPDKDYTPQGKQGERVLKTWFEVVRTK